MIIDERVERVKMMLGNRHDLELRIIGWLRDAYIELGMAYKFSELEDTYNMPTVIGTDTYDYPVTDPAFGSRLTSYETRAIKNLTIKDSTGFPRPLYPKAIRTIDRYQTITRAAPSVYSSYGRQIVIRSVPNAIYTLVWRIWVKPLIEDNVGATIVLLPDDWLEILDYSAALRGHTELLERDKAQEVFGILHGAEDPRSGRRVPGLIDQRLTQRQAESENEEYALAPRIRRYTG